MQIRNNSFDFVRFVAASGVIFSHHFPIAGYEEPFIRGVSIGTMCVSIFFLMSGFLICKSVQANDDFSRFLAARLLRIVPNLAFVLVVTSIATIFMYANYTNWLLHIQYIFQNLAMLVRGGVMFRIPGVFENRPMNVLNGSLWTLPYEIWCYFILYGILRFLPSFCRQIILALAGISFVVALYADFSVPTTAIDVSLLGRLGLWFFLGAAFAAFSASLPFLSSPTFSWFSKWGDPSYGMYITAWPIQQFTTTVVHDFWLGMILSWIATIALGYATWHIFERKALLQIGPLSAFFRTQFKTRGNAKTN
jgi:peptidoglycan/LPS O-acetylase OafA/YrhL